MFAAPALQTHLTKENETECLFRQSFVMHNLCMILILLQYRADKYQKTERSYGANLQVDICSHAFQLKRKRWKIEQLQSWLHKLQEDDLVQLGH